MEHAEICKLDFWVAYSSLTPEQGNMPVEGAAMDWYERVRGKESGNEISFRFRQKGSA